MQIRSREELQTGAAEWNCREELDLCGSVGSCHQGTAVATGDGFTALVALELSALYGPRWCCCPSLEGLLALDGFAFTAIGLDL